MAEKKIAPTQSFAQPVDRLDAPQPIQRRAGGHDPRAQLRQNAQFMAQMKAQQAPVVQRKEDQIGVDDSNQPTPEQLNHLRSSVAKTNVYLRGIVGALRTYGHYHPEIAKGADLLTRFTGTLAQHAGKAAPMLKGVGVFSSVIIGLDRIIEAKNGEEFVVACGETAVHLAMGFTPVTAALDGILSVAIGTDWPTKLAKFLAGLSFEAYFEAWKRHHDGTGEMLIPAGPKKM